MSVKFWHPILEGEPVGEGEPPGRFFEIEQREGLPLYKGARKFCFEKSFD
jgi:hypothetical protein